MNNNYKRRPATRFGRGRGGNGYSRYGRGNYASESTSVYGYIERASQKSYQATEAVSQAQMPIQELDLPASLLANIRRRGYTGFTPIQAKGIPAIREGRDIIGIANTGTGKTAAFLIPLIEQILNDRGHRSLIITPTRELALQIREELALLSHGMDILSALCIGQSSMHRQISQLDRDPQVVIGTPGRLKDLISRRRLKLDRFRMVVLDEADRMLDMGFINDVRQIISCLSPSRQSLFFSATISMPINRLIQAFVKNAVTVSVKTQETVSHIRQETVKVEHGDTKLEKLGALLSQAEFTKVLVFGRTKRGVEKLYRELSQRGFKVASIHGNKTQPKRYEAIRLFKENRVRVLVATDVAARGLDIDSVSHVINYDAPQTYEDYIHRIGRTGRANNEGTALTFV